MDQKHNYWECVKELAAYGAVGVVGGVVLAPVIAAGGTCAVVGTLVVVVGLSVYRLVVEVDKPAAEAQARLDRLRQRNSNAPLVSNYVSEAVQVVTAEKKELDTLRAEAIKACRDLPSQINSAKSLLDSAVKTLAQFQGSIQAARTAAQNCKSLGTSAETLVSQIDALRNRANDSHTKLENELRGVTDFLIHTMCRSKAEVNGAIARLDGCRRLAEDITRNATAAKGALQRLGVLRQEVDRLRQSFQADEGSVERIADYADRFLRIADAYPGKVEEAKRLRQEFEQRKAVLIARLKRLPEVYPNMQEPDASAYRALLDDVRKISDITECSVDPGLEDFDAAVGRNSRQRIVEAKLDSQNAWKQYDDTVSECRELAAVGDRSQEIDALEQDARQRIEGTQEDAVELKACLERATLIESGNINDPRYRELCLGPQAFDPTTGQWNDSTGYGPRPVVQCHGEPCQEGGASLLGLLRQPAVVWCASRDWSLGHAGYAPATCRRRSRVPLAGG